MAKVVCHVNEVAEQKTDRSDRLQQTNLTSLNTSSTRQSVYWRLLILFCSLALISGVNTSAAVVWRWLARADGAGTAAILLHWSPALQPSHRLVRHPRQERIVLFSWVRPASTCCREGIRRWLV